MTADGDGSAGQREPLGTALGRPPADWALSEDLQRPTYEAALRPTRARAGTARARHRLWRRRLPPLASPSAAACRTGSTPPRR